MLVIWVISYSCHFVFVKSNCVFAGMLNAHIYTNCLILRLSTDFFGHVACLMSPFNSGECVGKSLERAVSVLYYDTLIVRALYVLTAGVIELCPVEILQPFFDMKVIICTSFSKDWDIAQLLN